MSLSHTLIIVLIQNQIACHQFLLSYHLLKKAGLVLNVLLSIISQTAIVKLAVDLKLAAQVPLFMKNQKTAGPAVDVLLKIQMQLSDALFVI